MTDLQAALTGAPSAAAVADLKQPASAPSTDSASQHLQAVSSQINALWQEYEAATTAEARLLKDLDKLEMLVTAYEYERDQRRVLPSFYASAVPRIQHPIVQSLVRELMRRRQVLPHIAAPSDSAAAAPQGASKTQ
jgi:5'-deoxynucleotidase YfbR-like HD superfamily hydrolase